MTASLLCYVIAAVLGAIGFVMPTFRYGFVSGAVAFIAAGLALASA